MKTTRGAGREEGFTLVETLVATSLGVAALGLMLSIYIGMQKNFIVGNSYINIHQDARMAMDWLTRDIRWAVQLLPSHGAYTTSDNCIVFQVPSIDAAGNVIDVHNDHDFIIYNLTADTPAKLERTVDAKNGVSSRIDETRTVADNISSLGFSYNGTALSGIGNLSAVSYLEIALTTGTTVTGVDLTDTISTTAKFRNRG